jgi:hypothetical protein
MSVPQFGTGVLFAVPNAGNLAANPTPYKYGVLQEASIEFKGDLKKLYGTKQFPVAKARGKIDVSCKAKLASLDPGMINQLYFGQLQTSGITIAAEDEAAIIPGTPFQVVVTNGAHFVTDFGVIDTATGAQLTKVPLATTPTTGQYHVDPATGTYTFAAADTTKAVKISYTYTLAATGATITLANQSMGYAPEFRGFLFNNFRGKRFGIELLSCTMGQLTIPTKQEDFWMSDITFDAGVDATDTLGYIYGDLF